MKKTILIFTIACASQLYCMDSNNISNTSTELSERIIKTAVARKNLNEAIEAIRELSGSVKISFNQIFNNFDDFTKLVIALANKFNVETSEITAKFNIPMAREYEKKFNTLYSHVTQSDSGQGLEPLIKLLAENKGIAKLDPEILFTALDLKENTVEVIKLLLQNGANPYAKDKYGKTILERVSAYAALSRRADNKHVQIKTLLEDAMERQPQK